MNEAIFPRPVPVFDQYLVDIKKIALLIFNSASDAWIV